MEATGRESELDAPTTLGTSERCDGSLTNFGVGVSASPMEGDTAVGTEGCELGAATVPGQMFSPPPRSVKAWKKEQRATGKKQARNVQRGAEQTPKS